MINKVTARNEARGKAGGEGREGGEGGGAMRWKQREGNELEEYIGSKIEIK